MGRKELCGTSTTGCYGYAQFPPGADEARELDRILRDAEKRGLYCISDEDARDPSGPHPAAHLWDTGVNAIDELDRMMRLRQHALARFGENNIRNGAPWSTLEEPLVTTYLMHRYQVEAAVKVVGGVNYRYGLRGDGQPPPVILDSATQRRALSSLLATVQPEALELPERLLALLPPPADGYDKTREYFRSRTGRTFDALAPVESAASLVVGLLLHPERAGRLVQQKARRSDLPGLDGLFDALFEATFQKSDRAGLRGEVRRTVDLVTLYHLMALAVNDRAAPQARALALTRVAAWSDWMKKELANSSDRAQQAHWTFALNEVKRFSEDPKQLNLPKPLEAPPGMPIGDF